MSILKDFYKVSCMRDLIGPKTFGIPAIVRKQALETWARSRNAGKAGIFACS